MQTANRPSFAVRHSAFRIPHSAITLTEVLIAMGILTLGLLGVAALFPVAGFYVQKAEIADQGSAIARAAMADVVARGMLNPETWRVYEDGTIRIGSGASALAPASPLSRTFTRPLATWMRNQRAMVAANGSLTAAVRQHIVAQEFGSAYVIDPMAIAGAAKATTNNNNYYAHPFPATGYLDYYQHSAWNSWRGFSPADYYPWPVLRVTFAQPGTTPRQLTASLAGDLFSSHDDLALDLPDRNDLPAKQNWDLADTDGDGVADNPIARQWRGDYSWIVTVAPPTSAARDALADGGGGHEYNVSVVVFYKRPIARTDLPASSLNPDVMQAGEALQHQERVVRAKVVSSGLSGGQLLLERPFTSYGTSDGLTESPFGQLKVGQWLMLCGPHPASADADPRFVLGWYRVLAIDGKSEKLDARGNPTTDSNEPERRLVSLRGPEWPWPPVDTTTNLDSQLSSWLCVGICPGAVAVHTRTMRLEGNSPWGIE